jgi:hypothetical protein
MRIKLIAAAGLAVTAVAAFGSAGAFADPRPGAATDGPHAAARDAGDALGVRIESAIKAEGPFFTAAERATIERKCGYPAGSFDGFEVNISNGVLTCKDGRRVDDADMRALMSVAEPRIERRVEAVMDSAEVQGAIRAVADEATREALAAIDHVQIAREAAREAEIAVREVSRDIERSMAQAKRDSRRPD